MFFPVYVKGPFNHQGTWKTIAFGVVVPDREELLKQAFLASIPGHELTSKWNGIVLSTTCASVMVDGLTWRGMTRKENLRRSDRCVVPKCWEPITHWHSITNYPLAQYPIPEVWIPQLTVQFKQTLFPICAIPLISFMCVSGDICKFIAPCKEILWLTVESAVCTNCCNIQCS